MLQKKLNTFKKLSASSFSAYAGRKELSECFNYDILENSTKKLFLVFLEPCKMFHFKIIFMQHYYKYFWMSHSS